MRRVEPGPGKESVWDYPRPPRVEPSDALVVVEFAGQRVAETRASMRVLETSHPPVFYVPPADIVAGLIEPAAGRSFCEFKGEARYWSVRVGDRLADSAAWSYPSPAPGYEALADHLAFYPGRVDACYVDGEQVVAQDGDFYGGWITSSVVGPFKGPPGTLGW